MVIAPLQDCLRDLLGGLVAGALISSVVAYIMGVSIVIGTATVVAFSPGIIAALAALGFVLVVGGLVALGWCYVRCRRQQGG